MSQAPPPPGQPGSPMQPPPYGGAQPPGYGSPTPGGPGNNTVKILLVVGAVLMGLMLVCGGILAVFLWPAVGAARQAAQRMSCSNNLKQIGLAMHDYHSAYKQLPPAYLTNAEGERLHSWRVSLLPFMEQQALYEQIDLSRPWDDPVNQLIAETVIPEFSCPSNVNPTLTTYMVIDDDSTMFPGDQRQ